METNENKEDWRGRPIEIRQWHMFNGLLIPHPEFTSVVQEIVRLASRCRNEGDGRALLILGGSGQGKTYLIKVIQRMKPEDHSGIISRVPTVMFSIPSAPTARAFSSSLLHALRDPKYKTGAAADMLTRAIYLLGEIGTEIIFIDNVHDITARRSHDGIMHLGDWIRDLIDHSKCLIVLLGTPAAKAVVDANAQLRRRAAKLMKMAYFDIDTPQAKARFYRFLNELDKKMPLAEMSVLSEPSLAHRVFYATYGVMDYIIQLMTEAIAVAVTAGRECIVMVDLEKAFDTVFGDSANGCNPFSESGPARPLDQDGELFHNWFDKANPRLSRKLTVSRREQK
jgi:hypothetical protein